MRVGIGAVLNPTGGPARYAVELVRGLARLEGDEHYVVFTNRPTLFDPSPRVSLVEVPLVAAVLEPYWDHVALRRAARRESIDLYHGVKGAIPIDLDCPRLVTIHDLAIYACPETFAWQQHLHMRPHLWLAARQARLILADSEHARGDIVRRLRVPAELVRAVPLGVRHEVFTAEPGARDEETAQRLGLPTRFFLYTGTLQPRKNVDVVVQAYRGPSGLDGWQLLIAGRVRPDYHPSWMDSPPAGVRVLDSPSDEELAVLYRRARALVSPSSYEGFGLTFLEAMASGCPVVGTSVTSLPEVVGDAGMLLPRPDVDAIRTAMKSLADDDDLHRDLSRRGRARAAQFTWDATARRTRDIYLEVSHG